MAHSDKEGATPTYTRSFGFHPLLGYLDGANEALAGILRPGNAGANPVADHIAVLTAALAQLPDGVGAGFARHDILVRADSAGATHAFLDRVSDMGMGFSVGVDLTEPVRRAVLSLPGGPGARRSPRTARFARAHVAEILPGLRGWPAGARAMKVSLRTTFTPTVGTRATRTQTLRIARNPMRPRAARSVARDLSPAGGAPPGVVVPWRVGLGLGRGG